MTKRLLTLCLALVLVFSLLPVSLPVSADEQYPNTHTNTGDQRYDIIQVALTQVGYQEGSNNYTKYGEYFNWPNTAWCGWFVSWCAAKAEVPTSVLKRQGKAYASNFGLTSFKASERLPQPGDLYFKSGHVGFVYKVEGNYFWSVEGNSNDQVEIEKMSLYSSKYWFASPNYGGSSNNSSHTHSYETGYDSGHPHKEYKQCTSCSHKTYTDNTRTVEGCSECLQENCDHSYGSWASIGSSKHAKTCSKCGKEQTGSHDWEDISVIKEATCKTEGSKKQKCDVCSAERTKSIEKTSDHSYSDWAFQDDEHHSRKCTVCGRKVEKDHSIDEETKYKTTETEHWQECVVCKEKFSLAEHTFGEDCVSPCEVCEYVRRGGHPFAEEWSVDEENHWLDCTACDAIGSQEPHIYSAECDEDCDVCGHVREVEHTFPDTMDTDGTSHWYECDVCGKVDGQQNHIPGAQATEENSQNCTVCDYELVARIPHVHDYAPMKYDSQTHWGTCRCGLDMGPEAHSWDITTGNCSLCGVVSVAETETRNWEFVWVIIGGSILCTLIVTASVMARSRKKRKDLEPDTDWA